MLLFFKIIIYFAGLFFIIKDLKNRNKGYFLWLIAAVLLCIDIFNIEKGILAAFAVYLLFIIFYFIVRPKGELVYCANCFKKKILKQPYCPHCFAIDEKIINDEFMLAVNN